MALNAPATYEFGDQFQRHALAVLARVPGGIIRYRSALDPTFFGSATLRTISEVLFEHVDANRNLPQKPTLLEELREKVADEDYKRAAKSVERMYSEDVTDAKAVFQRVIEFGRQQAYVNATLKAAEDLERGKREVRKYFDAAGLVGEDLLDLGVDYRRNVKERRAYYLDPSAHEDRISTGLPHLDALMGGGLCRKELGVILAPPKRGKSTVLINIAYGAVTSPKAYNVAHYSLEMHQDRIARRYDDRLMGKRVTLRGTDPERYGQRLSERVKTYVRGRLFVKHYPTRSATVSKIRSHLTLLSARGFTPDLIVVDYADIMKPERRLGEMRHEQAGIYEDLRQLADEYDAAVWTGSQASRGALEKETVTIEDFSEAFEKAAIVDAAIAFCLQRDQSVVTKDGPVKIWDIKRRIEREPVYVLSHNFETGVDEWKKVKHWFHNGLAPRDGFVRVKTEITGRSKGSVTTPDHEYFRPDGSKVPARELRVGSLVMGRAYALSDAQRQMVLGTMLGDGHLRRNGALAVEHGVSQAYYLRWKAEALVGLPCAITAIERDASLINGVAVTARTSNMLTVRGLDLKRLRRVFYPRGRKIVPQSVLDELGPLGLAVWFMDDGTIAKSGDRVVLYTNGYSDADRARMVEWFSDRWNLDCVPRPRDGALEFSAHSSRSLLRRLARFVIHDPGPRRTKRFLCPVVGPGQVVHRPVRVLSIATADYVNRERLDIEVEDNHNFYLASGILVSNCQTQDERIEGRCRLYAAALRNAEDGRTVDCSIERNQARIRSLALFDVSGARILLQGEQHDENLETTSFVVKAKRKEEAQNLKRRAGISKDKPKRRREPRPSKKVA